MRKITIETKDSNEKVTVDVAGDVGTAPQANPDMLFKRAVTQVCFNLRLPRRQGVCLMRLYTMRGTMSANELTRFVGSINATDLGALLYKGLVTHENGSYRVSKAGNLVAQLLNIAEFDMA